MNIFNLFFFFHERRASIDRTTRTLGSYCLPLQQLLDAFLLCRLSRRVLIEGFAITMPFVLVIYVGKKGKKRRLRLHASTGTI